MSNTKKILSLAAIVSTAACSSYDPYDNSFRDDDFTRALAKYYTELAAVEEQMGDKVSAGVYNTKAENINYYYQPENVDLYDLEPEDRSELEQARASLASAYAAGAREIHPFKAGWVQSRFDCWMEQAEERTSQTCRTEFLNGYPEILGAAKPKPAPKPAPKPKPAPRPVVQRPAPDLSQYARTVVFFDHNKSLVQGSYDSKLAKVAEIQRTYNVPVIIMGHADTSGRKNYNIGLSDRRSKAVASKLKSYGVNPSQIKTFAFGEERLATSTPDGTRNQQNRRSEIILEIK